MTAAVASELAVRIKIPASPPSLNAVGARGGQRVFHRHKKLWQQMFAAALIAEPEFPASEKWERARAEVVIAFSTDRRRDPGNFRALLEKALGDALVGEPDVWPGGRWLPDDTADHYVFVGPELVVNPTLRGPGLVPGAVWADLTFQR